MKSLLKKNAKGKVFIKVVPKPTQDTTKALWVKLSKKHETETCLPVRYVNIQAGKQIYDCYDFGRNIIKHWIE